MTVVVKLLWRKWSGSRDQPGSVQLAAIRGQAAFPAAIKKDDRETDGFRYACGQAGNEYPERPSTAGPLQAKSVV